MRFFRQHRGHKFASSALMDPMTKAFVASMDRFAKPQQIPVVQFQKGQRQDDVMKSHLARFHKSEGVLFIGKAQEKTPVFRTEKRRNPETGHTYPWIVRSTAMVNHFYCYCVDQDFGRLVKIFMRRGCSIGVSRRDVVDSGCHVADRAQAEQGRGRAARCSCLDGCVLRGIII